MWQPAEQQAMQTGNLALTEATARKAFVQSSDIYDIKKTCVFHA
jgi:hypothetical protein